MTDFRITVAALGCLALAAGFAPSAARAESFVTGSQLASACASHVTADERSCSGYIAGALDEVVETPDSKAGICPPAKTKLGVLREAVAKFGKEQPDAAKGSGVALVHAMLKANYPCGKAASAN